MTAATSETDRFDVIIAGGGMTGGMLAAALAHDGGLSVCVLESALPVPFEPGDSPPPDIRVSALSIASERMFRRVGAWEGVMARRACPYREMIVWDGEPGVDDEHADRWTTRFDADEIHCDALGHIVENRVIQLALLECLERSPTVQLRCPASLGSFDVGEASVSVELGSGERLQARLLVGADGARSTVRSLAGIDHTQTPYEQHALVATVRTESPQQSVTWQRFVPSGPQAFLPLSGPHASMVWYHEAEEVARLKALDDASFIAEMEAAFPERLGRIDAVLERASFPIAKAHASRYVDERIALIGDAAHTVHPLAGQGVNLGMLDAAALAQTLTEAVRRGQDPGRGRVLRRYERWRQGENAVMIAALDGFHHAFGPRTGAVRTLRRAALGVANRAGPAKRFVMRRAMGTAGDLPELAR